MKKITCFLYLFFCYLFANAQAVSENLVVVTFDGFRWQELFSGADEALLNDVSFTQNSKAMKQKFWASSPDERRKKLLPFIWSVIAEEGQIYGNRAYSNFVNVKNAYRVSYPGYNEIFTGYPDPIIKDNDKNNNANTTVLSYLAEQPAFIGKVAAFASWEVFRYIFNKQQASFLVNAGIELMEIFTPTFNLLNEKQQKAVLPFGKEIRPDELTYALAKEYILEKKPKVLYIGFDDTDDWAHNKKYDHYLEAANKTDAYLADLWALLQSLPAYKNKTTLIITTDHGRGDAVKKEWTSHGKKIAGADQIWLMLLGQGVVAKGEIKEPNQVYQSQLAQTIAKFLGYSFTANHPVDEAIKLPQ